MCVLVAATKGLCPFRARHASVLRPVHSEVRTTSSLSAQSSKGTALGDWVAQELRQTFHADRRLLDTMLKVAAEAVRHTVQPSTACSAHHDPVHS